MCLTLVQQSLLQHVISELQFLYLTIGLEKLVLVGSKDFLNFAIRSKLVTILLIFLLAHALEGFANFKLETLKKLDVVLTLVGQKIIFFFQILHLL